MSIAIRTTLAVIRPRAIATIRLRPANGYYRRAWDKYWAMGVIARAIAITTADK